MPKRTNKFQKLIHLIHEQTTECKVVESALFSDRRTGKSREVDIAIISEIAGYPVVISIECRDHKRPQSSSWIEEMWAKHQALPTSSLILVSSSGFYSPAIKAADALGIEVLTLEEASSKDWPDSISRIRRFQYVETFKVPVRITVVPDEKWFPVGLAAAKLAEFMVFSAEGEEIGTLRSVFDQAASSVEIELTDNPSHVEDASFDSDFTLRFPKGVHLIDHEKVSVTLRELIFRLHFEGRLREVEPKMFHFKNHTVGAVDSTSDYAEIIYSIVVSEENKLSGGASVYKWKHQPPACKWDVGIPEEYKSAEVGDISMLNYNDPAQFETDGKPSPEQPNLKLKLELRSRPTGSATDKDAT